MIHFLPHSRHEESWKELPDTSSFFWFSSAKHISSFHMNLIELLSSKKRLSRFNVHRGHWFRYKTDDQSDILTTATNKQQWETIPVSAALSSPRKAHLMGKSPGGKLIFHRSDADHVAKLFRGKVGNCVVSMELGWRRPLVRDVFVTGTVRLEESAYTSNGKLKRWDKSETLQVGDNQWNRKFKR